jgi:hypothetical protein
MKIRMIFSGLLTLCLLSLCNAGPLKVYEISVTAGTNAGQVVSGLVSPDAGFIDSVTIDVVSSGSTCDVQVAISDTLSAGPTETVLAVTNIMADAFYRPVSANQSASGAASTLTESRYSVPYGRSVTMTLTNALASGKVYRALITMELSEK